MLTFKHGIHPEYYKHLTDAKPIERMPFAQEVVLPLGQHIGAPSVAIVNKGQTVKRGQMIAKPGGFVSVALHSPVDGKVKSIGLVEDSNGEMTQAITIETDKFSLQQLGTEKPKNYLEMSNDEFISSVQEAGIVGLGGAAFPAHVKFAIPKGKTCKYIILNGAECEPFLTADHRLMLEYAHELIKGVQILNHFIKAEKVFIGIEDNKADAIEALKQASNELNAGVEIMSLAVKYPQGAEKMLITAILNKEVPSGKLPIDVEVLVSNVGSIVALYQWFNEGKPLIERIMTVTGTAVGRPTNLLVPIGTSMKEVVAFSGSLKGQNIRMLLGGPMMGKVQKTLNTPVVKGTSGLLFLTENEIGSLDEYNCIKCGKCVDACPMFLNPSIMGLLAKKGLWNEMDEHHVLDCFECGSCSFVCPSGIPLVQSFRAAKGIIRERKFQKA